VPTNRIQLSMTSSPEVNSLNITWPKDGGRHQDLIWLLSFMLTFLVGSIVNVVAAYAATRWCLLQSRLRHFRSLGDALIGQCMSGVLSSCSGLLIVLITVAASSSYQPIPEVLCRAGAALSQLVLSSATAVAALYVFSHCDAVSCCLRLQEVMSTGRKVSPLVVGLISAAITLGDPASGNWLDSACAADDSATYRLPTVLAAVCFFISTAGTILVLSSHLVLRRPTGKVDEPLPVPLMELNTTVDDVQGRATSGDVTSAQQTCRISCEAAPGTNQHDTDDFGSWRCFSKMGLLATSSSASSSSSLSFRQL